MSFTKFRTACAAAGVAALSLFGAAGHAQATDIKFTLDWRFEGPAAPFLLALDRGYFAAEGLNVTIDSGNGSAGAVTRVASGAYDIAMADINSMIEFNASNPERAMTAMFVIYNEPPFSIFSLKSSNITTPADLAGQTRRSAT